MGSNCTNGGVTSNKRDVILIGEGIPEIFEPSERSPAVYLHIRPDTLCAGHMALGKDGSVKRVMVSPSEVDGRHGMFGGQFVYSSDGRFPFTAPIHVFDRFE